MDSLRPTRALWIACAVAACSGDPVATSAPPDAYAGAEASPGAGSPVGADVVAAAEVVNAKPWLPPQPVVVAIDPVEGPAGGMQQVTICGQNLGRALHVRFGESPALGLQVIGEGMIRATTPPRPAGPVDLHVTSLDRPDALLPGAYRFVADMAVSAVSPSHGPAAGGATVSVTGKGFAPGTWLLFGDRPALQVVIVDEGTAIAIAPPGAVGKVAVTAAGPTGQAVLKAAYDYRAAPSIRSVAPALGPLAGGGPVVLFGAALRPDKAQVHFVSGANALTAAIVAGSADHGSLTVTAPAAWSAGTWAVRYVNADGQALLAQAYSYVAADQGAAIVAVSPPELPANSPGPVTIALSGAIGADLATSAQVTFGGVAAKIVAATPGPGGIGATWIVQPSAHQGPTPVAVDVAVAIGPATLKKAAGFSWLAPVARIFTLAPAMLPTAGGAPVKLQVQASQAHGGVKALRIGALAASAVQVGPPLIAAADATVSATAPPGVPGPADVVATLGDGTQAVFAGGATYVAKQAALYGVVPGTGAQAGGTAVVAVGAGLSAVDKVWLGGAAISQWTLVHDGAISFKTPAHLPGAGALKVRLASGATLELANAFTWFDPTSADNGSWGGPIDGALNVTVLQKGKIGPVAGAVVLIGADPATPLQGLTDANGQVTLSVKGLAGPLHVHAAKKGWSAASAIALNAENITLRIQQFPAGGGPPSPNPPDPAPPPGTISATVVDAAKYTLFPLGTCKGEAVTDAQCKPCGSDAGCGAGYTCEELRAPLVAATLPGGPTESTGDRFCLAACAAHADCPPAAECRAIGADLTNVKFRCVPRIGAPQVRCEGSSPSIFGGYPKQPNDGVAAADGKVTVAITPGDGAAICRSGYVDKQSGEFVALAIGIKRKLFAFPGQHQNGVVISVNIPLDRTLRVRMDRVPVGPDAHGLRQLTTGIDLGAEGYLPLGAATTYAVTDTLVFERQPAPSLWGGDNGDLRYDFYGGVSQPYGAPPNATAWGRGFDPRGFDVYALLEPGATAAAAAGALTAPVLAGDEQGGLRVVVGAGGLIAHWTGGGFTQQPSPTSVALRAVWLAPDGKGDGWAAGDGGVLLRKTALGWKAWPQQAPRVVVDVSGRAAGDAWLVDGGGQLMHWDGASWQGAEGPWPPPAPVATNEAKAPPKQIRAIWHADDGALWLAGDGGTLLRRTVNENGKAVFKPVAAGTTFAIHDVRGDGAGGAWLCGDRGYVGRWNGVQVKPLATGITQPLYALRPVAGEGPADVVGGAGSWVRVSPNGEVATHTPAGLSVDLRAVVATFDGGRVAAGEPVVSIGPYLELPWWVVPAPGQAITGPTGVHKVAWQAAPGLNPTFNLVRIADSGYQTRWELFVRGEVTSAVLPNFDALGHGNPLPGGTSYLRVWRIYAPGTEIDHYAAANLTNWRWVSWAYNVRSTDEPAPPLGKPPTEAPKADLPGSWFPPGWPK